MTEFKYWKKEKKHEKLIYSFFFLPLQKCSKKTFNYVWSFPPILFFILNHAVPSGFGNDFDFINPPVVQQSYWLEARPGNLILSFVLIKLSPLPGLDSLRLSEF